MKQIKIQIIFFLLLSLNSFSQVVLDPTFGVDGKVTMSLSTGDDYISDIFLQADGKIVACGGIYSGFQGYYNFVVARYLNNGNLDNSFGTNGIVITSIFSSYTMSSNLSIIVQSDQKILISGTDASENFTLMRLNSDGSLDQNFGTNGVVTSNFGVYNFLESICLQSDGKILATGMIQNTLETNNFGIIRYNSDGTVDNTFGINGKTEVNIGVNSNPFGSSYSSDYSTDVKLQSDGKIILIGKSNFASSSTTYYNFAMVRLDNNGILDNSFGVNGLVVTDFGLGVENLSMVVLPNDDIIIGGNLYANSSQIYKIILAKYSSNGTNDFSYGVNGKSIIQTSVRDICNSLLLDDNGETYTIGTTLDGNSGDFLLVKNSANGFLDTNFNSTGYIYTDFNSNNDFGTSILKQSDDKILVAGYSNGDFALARYNLNGLSNDSFQKNTFTVSPNPFKNFINIDFNLENTNITSIDLYDIYGRKIEMSFNNFQSVNKSLILEMPDYLSEGNYFLKIITDNQSQILKIEKNK